MPCVTCYVSTVTCHLSPVTCHLTIGPRRLGDADTGGFAIDRLNFFIRSYFNNLRKTLYSQKSPCISVKKLHGGDQKNTGRYHDL